MITARMNCRFFAHAVESHFTVRTPRSSETGSECFAVSDPASSAHWRTRSSAASVFSHPESLVSFASTSPSVPGSRPFAKGALSSSISMRLRRFQFFELGFSPRRRRYVATVSGGCGSVIGIRPVVADGSRVDPHHVTAQRLGDVCLYRGRDDHLLVTGGQRREALA